MDSMRVIRGACEISTGAFEPETKAPLFQGENGAVRLEVQMLQDGVPYAIPTAAQARYYLNFDARKQMTPQTEMEVSGSIVAATIGSAHTLLSGSPDIVVILLDEAANLIVSCMIPIRIIETREKTIVYENPVPPGVTIYVGRSPYIGENDNWYEWDDSIKAFKDTGVRAHGNVNYAMVGIGEDGNLYLYATNNYDGAMFRINDDGDLEVYTIAEY